MRNERDDRPADAEPEARARVDASVQTIKPWILPTGNPFIKDPAKRHTRWARNWGGDVAYVRPDFDDASWRRVDLPHDWAIEGPFLVDGPHGGMGRLPSWGVAWYRKKLDIPPSDAGKSRRRTPLDFHLVFPDWHEQDTRAWVPTCRGRSWPCAGAPLDHHRDSGIVRGARPCGAHHPRSRRRATGMVARWIADDGRRNLEHARVPWKRDPLPKSRSAAPGWQGATTAHIGHM